MVAGLADFFIFDALVEACLPMTRDAPAGFVWCMCINSRLWRGLALPQQ
jgi:hypothetical protein